MPHFKLSENMEFDTDLKALVIKLSSHAIIIQIINNKSEKGLNVFLHIINIDGTVGRKIEEGSFRVAPNIINLIKNLV